MEYDLMVIGGGPAGLMAAGRAGELGARVLLLEKNETPGVKLLLTGKERCNLTHNCSAKEIVKAFSPKGKFLFSALSCFSPSDTIEFFESRGIKIKIEADDRAFPQSDKARDILEALLDYLKQSKVTLIGGAAVKKISQKDNLITRLVLADGRKFSAANYLLAAGGKSYPLTGSSGDGYGWLEKFGHTIVKPVPALTPLIIKNEFIKKLEGVSLAEARFTFKKENKIITTSLGEAIFTANGLSGPAIINVSGLIARHLPGIRLSIDFFPDQDLTALDASWQELFSASGNRQIGNIINHLLPAKLIAALLKLADIPPETKANQLRKNDRINLVRLAKNLEFAIDKVDGFDKAMLTSGGVDLKEIDPGTMRSKIIGNLFLAGEILDLNGPTGGYNLQECWSTGRLAGESAASFALSQVD